MRPTGTIRKLDRAATPLVIVPEQSTEPARQRTHGRAMVPSGRGDQPVVEALVILSIGDHVCRPSHDPTKN
jgi:hypothetical protein